MSSEPVVTPVDPATAPASDVDQYFDLLSACAATDSPAAAPPVRAAAVQRLTLPASATRTPYTWFARDGGRLVGVGHLMLVSDIGLADIDIKVRPEYRRRGVGTALLRAAAVAAEGYANLLIQNLPEGGAGSAWADVHGFSVALRTVRQNLDLRTADRTSWEIPAAPGYRVARWSGTVPDEYLASYAAARNAMRDAPHGAMAFRMPDWTPEMIRRAEDVARAEGCELRLVAAIHEETGAVVGLTEIDLYERRPDLGIQQDTTVLGAHRGHRLGLWIKAENLWWLAADRPAVEIVRTSTAADNTHMRRVNEQLGFVADLATQNREADVAALTARLTVSPVA
ncbi:GNAT family N-acetyltransferase [Longispora sp. K20-0274]|uniref:GNAT family N-acetyltransferase n=1 Tax=Longispora sp. K20-0274 TaxID=3088255 RepID=UPI00399A7CFA